MSSEICHRRMSFANELSEAESFYFVFILQSDFDLLALFGSSVFMIFFLDGADKMFNKSTVRQIEKKRNGC